MKQITLFIVAILFAISSSAVNTALQLPVNNDTLSKTDSVQVMKMFSENVKQSPDLGMLIVCGVIGIFLHFMRKAKRLREQAEAAKLDFNIKQLLKSESYTIISSFAVLALALICRENIMSLKYGSIVVGAFIYPTFALIGWFGDSLMDAFFGGYEAKLKKLSGN